MDSKVKRLHSLALLLIGKFGEGKATSCIHKAVSLNREALGLYPSGHPDRFDSLTCLATSLDYRHRHLGAMRDLEEAIILGREALGLRPQGHPDRLLSVYNLAFYLFTQYWQLGAMPHLDEAIILGREALDLCPRGRLDRPMVSSNLAICLCTRYNQLGVMSDLDEAIILGREPLDLHPQGHPVRLALSNNLAAFLFTRYKQLGVISDFDEAIALSREALDLHPREHPDRSMSLNRLASSLSARYDQLGAMSDLDETIILNREALSLCPQGHPGRSESSNNLALRLFARYSRLGVMSDLDEAIILGREAVDLRPQGHLDRSASLNGLSLCLSTRYKQLRVMSDLDEAIDLDREALDLQLKGHLDRSKSLANLAVCLSFRYHQLGVLSDLDEAVVLAREALVLRPQGHPDRSMSLNNLSLCLSTRYKQLRVMLDLDEAITLGREALDLRPQGHLHRPMLLNNLATHLSTRYEQLGFMSDLDEAIVLNREALVLRSQGHPDRSMPLSNLSACLSARHARTGVMSDLDEAAVLSREALDLRPQGHPDRPGSLNNLAIHLFIRYKLGITESLDEAIILLREALSLLPRGHPLRSQSLDNLALCLGGRFIQLGQLEDEEEVFRMYSELVHVDQIVSSADMSATRAWVHAAEAFQHPTLLLAYETSLRLLIQYLTTLPSLPQHLIVFKKLTSSFAVDAFTACLHRHTPVLAVELLEQGRSVFWSQLTRLRSPLHDVIMSGPAGEKLAGEFTRLASLIHNASNSPGVDQHGRLCHLNLEMQRVVTDIRNLPGFSRFLLPSLFSDLQCAASSGPVIIVNASKHGCDVLVILLSRDPVHMPLQITQDCVQDMAMELCALTARARRGDVTKELASFLRKLWDQVVSSIVNLLRTIHSIHSRIWWCPTAEFSLLPLHAAGPYRKGELNLPDLYISSYTPTLTSLIRARRYGPSNSAVGLKRFVAIGQAEATGENELHSVGAELDSISKWIGDLAAFTRIEGEESRVPRVTEELCKNEWVHLACHGLPNRTQPFESAFALRDDHLTIQRIVGCELKNPEFAYLSACHTTVGDEESLDEAIHLASAMLFAGFRSVIGTMWAVDDGAASKITSTFYKYMVDESGRLDHTRAAFALNRTMKSVNIPLDQRVLYVHIGA